MKRSPEGEPEGGRQGPPKAAKEGDAQPGLVQADPLLVFLQDLSTVDANDWHAVLLGRRVRSLGDLEGLAHDTGWEGFLQDLRDAKEPVLASKLNAWRQRLGLREPSGGDSPGKLLARARPSYFRSLPRSKKGRVRATCFPLLCFLLALVPL